MKVTRNQIIFIIILSIILIGSITAYFLTRTKDNYQHKVGLFSKQMLNENRLQIQNYNEFKNQQFLLFQHRIKNLKGSEEESKEQSPEEIEKRKLEKEKADKDQKKMVEAIADAKKSLAKNILKDIYGIASCALIDKKGNKCLSDDVLINLAKDVGIGLLKIGLTCAGLGFIGGALDSIFSGGKASGPPPIDYAKIASIVSDALNKKDLENFVKLMNDTNTSIQDFITTYMGDKQNNTYSISVDETQDEIGKFLLKPNNFNPDIQYDPNTIAKVGTAQGKTKRQYLNDLLDQSNLYDLVTGKNIQNSIVAFMSITGKDLKVDIQLYPIFLNLISYYIIYYQEKASIDLSSIKGDNNVTNPWISSYIGQGRLIGSKQTGSSLLAKLQNLCEKYFEFLKNIFSQFISKIIHKDESSSGCDDHIVWHKCERWGTSVDGSGVIPDSWIDQYNKVYKQNWKKYYHIGDEGNRWNTTVILQNQRQFCVQLNEYMNKPFEALYLMKEMAGIAFLQNEKSYDYQLGTHSTPNSISYMPNGGYPFGLSKMSYSHAIQYFNLEGSQPDISYQQSTGSLCSPIYFGKQECIKCPGGEEKCINIIGKDMINKTLGNRQVSSDVYCEKGYGIQSCLDINQSPGNIETGIVSPNSRSVFCINDKNPKPKKFSPYVDLNYHQKDICTRPTYDNPPPGIYVETLSQLPPIQPGQKWPSGKGVCPESVLVTPICTPGTQGKYWIKNNPSLINGGGIKCVNNAGTGGYSDCVNSPGPYEI
jgi:hypothetical protein